MDFRVRCLENSIFNKWRLAFLDAFNVVWPFHRRHNGCKGYLKSKGNYTAGNSPFKRECSQLVLWLLPPKKNLCFYFCTKKPLFLYFSLSSNTKPFDQWSFPPPRLRLEGIVKILIAWKRDRSIAIYQTEMWDHERVNRKVIFHDFSGEKTMDLVGFHCVQTIEQSALAKMAVQICDFACWHLYQFRWPCAWVAPAYTWAAIYMGVGQNPVPPVTLKSLLKSW